MDTPKQESKMNYFDIQDNYLTITSNVSDTDNIIDEINRHIQKQNVDNLNVDISSLNMIDALKVSVGCSTAHFVKYPFGKIRWFVKDIQTRNLIKTLSLKTVEISIKKPIIKDFYATKSNKVVALRY